MKQLLIIGLLAIFSSFFACSISNDAAATEPADVPQVNANPQLENVNNKDKKPVLVELFTSEGCSSCPPADRVLAQLEAEQPNKNAEIITLALHVDYWDNIGWKDEFSSALYSQRQNVYGQAFKMNQIYTPQMIVDGEKQFVGSNMSEANKAITESAKDEKANVELANAENNLKIKISDIPNHENASVFLAIAEDNLSTNVKGGENSGRKLEHTSVVRELKSIGSVTSQQNSFDNSVAVQLQPDWKKENLKFVVFVQENGSRKILGVNRINSL
ncbi:MAG: DUF1223 domain-containing protein [Acidobacteriota bacterium]